MGKSMSLQKDAEAFLHTSQRNEEADVKTQRVLPAHNFRDTLNWVTPHLNQLSVINCWQKPLSLWSGSLSQTFSRKVMAPELDMKARPRFRVLWKGSEGEVTRCCDPMDCNLLSVGPGQKYWLEYPRSLPRQGSNGLHVERTSTDLWAPPGSSLLYGVCHQIDKSGAPCSLRNDVGPQLYALLFVRVNHLN